MGMDGSGGECVDGHLEGLFGDLLHGQASILSEELRKEKKKKSCPENASIALLLQKHYYHFIKAGSYRF